MFIRLGPYLNLNHGLDLVIGENFAKICHHEAEFRRADQSVAVLVKNLTNYLQLYNTVGNSQNLQITGFKLRTYGFGSYCPTNWATIIAQTTFCNCCKMLTRLQDPNYLYLYVPKCKDNVSLALGTVKSFVNRFLIIIGVTRFSEILPH